MTIAKTARGRLEANTLLAKLKSVRDLGLMTEIGTEIRPNKKQKGRGIHRNMIDKTLHKIDTIELMSDVEEMIQGAKTSKILKAREVTET